MSKNETKEAWNWLKLYGTDQQKKLFRRVYRYIETLEKRIAELEKIHDQHMAPQMFKKVDPKESLIQFQIEKRRKEFEQPQVYSPLKDRLKKMLDEGLRGSDVWTKTLKWNNLTEEKAMELVKNEKNQT